MLRPADPDSEHAPAKLNLALHVRHRRPDGYHEIETIFAFTTFGDTLRAAAADTLTLTVTGPESADIGPGEDNLVLRAARMLAERAGVRARAALSLTKSIPVAAGLGGGSADAAAALRLLYRFWNLDLPRESLTELAAELGSDVPACVASWPCVGRGRGEALMRFDLGLDGAAVLLVRPRVAMPTGPVFAAWDGVDRGPLDWEKTAWLWRNDLTEGAVRLAPEIGEVLAWLAAQPGAAGIRMSGSGATAFALFEDRRDAIVASNAVPSSWWSCRTQLRRPGGDGGPPA